MLFDIDDLCFCHSSAAVCSGLHHLYCCLSSLESLQMKLLKTAWYLMGHFVVEN